MANTEVDRARGDRLEAELAARLYAPMTRGRQTPADPLFASLREEELEIAAATIQQMVRDRTHRGTGGLMEWYPGTIRGWRAENPEDARLEKLTARFCASPAAAAWREAPSGVLGISIEEAFYRFFLDAEVGDPLLCEEEFLGALVRGLAVTPEAQFLWPKVLREAPGGCQAVTRRGVLHAAIDGRYLHGPVTPLVAALLSREPLEDVMRRHSLTLTTMGPVLESLRAMALLP